MSDLIAWTPPVTAAPYLKDISMVERRYNMPQNLLARLLYQESHYRPDVISGKIKSRAGAMGIAQVMPATARQPGFGVPSLGDPFNPFEAIPWAGQYLYALYIRLGSWDKALAAYNWGYGYVSRAIEQDGEKWKNALPRETYVYVNDIGRDVSGVIV